MQNNIDDGGDNGKCSSNIPKYDPLKSSSKLTRFNNSYFNGLLF